MKYLPKARNENIVVQNLHDEVLVYDLTINKAFRLNETASIIWQLCDGERQVFEINRQLNETLKSSVNEDLIWFALGQLKKENLLAGAEDMSAHFETLNRREVIRKIGVASTVALPVIYSLIAPTAASAQSGQPNNCKALGQSCFQSSECCSTYCDDCFTGTCQPNPGGLGGCL
jgi:hypothetical protein